MINMDVKRQNENNKERYVKKSRPKPESAIEESVQIADEELKTTCVQCLRRIFILLLGSLVLTTGWITILASSETSFTWKVATAVAASYGALTALVNNMIAWRFDLKKRDLKNHLRSLGLSEKRFTYERMDGIQDESFTEDVYFGQHYYRPGGGRLCQFMYIIGMTQDVGHCYVLYIHNRYKVRDEKTLGNDAKLAKDFTGLRVIIPVVEPDAPEKIHI